MAPQINEHCENCLTPFVALHRCAGCKVTRYCSKSCQRQHWKTHKMACRDNVAVREYAAQLSPYHAQRQQALQVWCEKNSAHVVTASTSALEVMKDRNRTGSFVFMVYLDAEHSVENPSSPNPIFKFRHPIRDAKCLTLARIHEMFDHTLKGGYEAVERCLSPRPGMLRNYVYDDFPGLRPYTLPCHLPKDCKVLPYRYRWLEELRADVKRNDIRTER